MRESEYERMGQRKSERDREGERKREGIRVHCTFFIPHCRVLHRAKE